MAGSGAGLFNPGGELGTMSGTSEVAPDTLSVDLQDAGVEVEYTDGRTVFYHGVPTPVDSVTTAPGKETHVLVTNEAGTHGVLTYVNEQTTEDDQRGRIAADPHE